MTITPLQAPSLVDPLELVQVRFTLCSRDQWSMGMHQDGCKSLCGIQWIMFHGYLDYFQKPSFGGRSNLKPSEDHGTLNTHDRWFILF